MKNLIKPRNRAGFFLLLYLLVFAGYAQQATKSDTTSVHVTKTGSKYHVETCRYLKYSQIQIQIGEAQRKGYEACLVCKPGTTVSKTKTSTSDTEVPYATSQRCSATTQKGTRCKRMTKNASGKCWQHE